MSDRLKQLSDAGVSIWLDDLSRERIKTGNLEQLIRESSVVGVTTNPTIFASALSKGELYDDQMRELAALDSSVDDAIKALTTDDVRNGCDLFTDVYTATKGFDGRVSIEVQPGLAMDTEGISVNVTLIFALERYRGVIDAYLSGLEQAAANGHDLSKIHSVASFFVSRVDTEVDKRLDAIGGDTPASPKGKAAPANPPPAHAPYQE